jgi:hypothetical protein
MTPEQQRAWDRLFLPARSRTVHVDGVEYVVVWDGTHANDDGDLLTSRRTRVKRAAPPLRHELPAPVRDGYGFRR